MDVVESHRQIQEGGVLIREHIVLPEHQARRVNPIEEQHSIKAEALKRIREQQGQEVILKQRHEQEVAIHRSASLKASLARKSEQVRALAKKVEAAKVVPIEKRGVAPRREVEVVQKRQQILDTVKQHMKELSIRKSDVVNKFLVERVRKLADKIPIEQVPRVLNMIGRTKVLSERVKGEVVPASQHIIEDVSSVSASSEGALRITERNTHGSIRQRELDLANMAKLDDMFNKLTNSLGEIGGVKDRVGAQLYTERTINLDRANAAAGSARGRAGEAFTNRDGVGAGIETNTGLRDSNAPKPSDTALVERNARDIETAARDISAHENGRGVAARNRDEAFAAAGQADVARTRAAGDAASFTREEGNAQRDLGAAQSATPSARPNDIVAAARELSTADTNVAGAKANDGNATAAETAARGRRIADESAAAAHNPKIPDAVKARDDASSSLGKADSEHTAAATDLLGKEGVRAVEHGKLETLRNARDGAAADMPSNVRGPEYVDAVRTKENIDTNLLPMEKARGGDADTHLAPLKDLSPGDTDRNINLLEKVEPVLAGNAEKLTKQHENLAKELNTAVDGAGKAEAAINGLLSEKGAKLPDLVALQEHIAAREIVNKTVPKSHGEDPSNPTVKSSDLEGAAGNQLESMKALKDKRADIAAREKDMRPLEDMTKPLEEKLNNLNKDEPGITKSQRELEAARNKEGGKLDTAKEAAGKASEKAGGAEKGLGSAAEDIKGNEVLRDGATPTEKEGAAIKKGEEDISAADKDSNAANKKREGAAGDAETAKRKAARAEEERRAAADDAVKNGEAAAKAREGEPTPPDRPTIRDEDVDGVGGNRKRAVEEDVAAVGDEAAATKKRKKVEEDAGGNKEDIRRAIPDEDAAHKASKQAEGEHIAAEKALADAEGRLKDVEGRLNELEGKRDAYQSALDDAEGKGHAELERLKELIKSHDELINAQKELRNSAEENLQRVKDGLESLPEPDTLKAKIKELEDKLAQHELVHERLNKIKETLKSIRDKGKGFLDALGLTSTLMGILGNFLNGILECAIDPKAYPHCNKNNQVFSPSGQPIPPEKITGIDITDGYGHSFTVHPLTPPTTPYVPPRWPPFVMNNVACIFGSSDYLAGCGDGSERGEADGSIDGEKDQIAQNDRILYYTPDDITNRTRIDPDLSGQKLQTYCNQLINAPQMVGKDIMAIFPECAPIFKQRGIQSGGGAVNTLPKSPDYMAGYTYGYNTAYIKSYDLAWIQSYAVTIHVLPKRHDGPGYGPGYGYGYGYGEKTPKYGYGYGETTPKYGYGYGETTPKYGYGYGETTPKYGYGYGPKTPDYGPETPDYGPETPDYGPETQSGGSDLIKALKGHVKGKLHISSKYQNLLEKIGKRTSCK